MHFFHSTFYIVLNKNLILIILTFCSNYFFKGITKRILKETDKPLFVYVGYSDSAAWNEDLDSDCKTAQRDACYLQKFLSNNNNKIAGIVLNYISENVSMTCIICCFLKLIKVF